MNIQDDEERYLPVLIKKRITGNHENYMKVLENPISIAPNLVDDMNIEKAMKAEFTRNVWKYVKHSLSLGTIDMNGKILGYKGPLAENYIHSIALKEDINIKVAQRGVYVNNEGVYMNCQELLLVNVCLLIMK